RGAEFVHRRDSETFILVRSVRVWARRLYQKFMDDRALTLASLLAWGMLNTLLPLLLGILSLVGLVLGDTQVARTLEQRVYEVLPGAASTVLHDAMVALQPAAGAAGLVSL